MANQRGDRERARRFRPRLTILVKLLLAFAVPTMALFAVFAVFAHQVAQRDLEAELGTRLTAVAASAATQIRGKYLVELGPGDEDDRGYLNTKRKLETLVEATGVARIYIFDRDFVLKVGSDPDAVIGSKLFVAQLDRSELARVFADGRAVASIPFTGNDGKQYQAGYAPVRASENEPEIVLALGVDASPTYFARLADLRRSLFLYGALLALVVLAISVITATLITRPVRRLATAAERIGKGDLAAPVQRSSRDEIGFLAETMDEMRGELQARDERMQLMLSGIAHEVRNPLGGIELFAGILRDEIGADDAEKQRHVARIERELGYLKAVVNDFLEYARRPKPELGEVELGELVRDVIELAHADAADPSGCSEVTIDSELEPATCRADPGQLRRALLNLVCNAVQASRDAEPRRVRVAVGCEGDWATVSVTNRGAPIPAEVRDRMFEPFFTTREKGTGLGLAFVREIIDDHDGEVVVESSPETGTVFTVRLPRAVAD